MYLSTNHAVEQTHMERTTILCTHRALSYNWPPSQSRHASTLPESVLWLNNSRRTCNESSLHRRAWCGNWWVLGIRQRWRDRGKYQGKLQASRKRKFSLLPMAFRCPLHQHIANVRHELWIRISYLVSQQLHKRCAGYDMSPISLIRPNLDQLLRSATLC